MKHFQQHHQLIRSGVFYCIFLFCARSVLVESLPEIFRVVCCASAGEMMKLVGQFGSIRARFSIRHLFLFSASALLVIVTYRPYSNNNSPVLSAAVAENADVIDSDHPTSSKE